MYTKHLGPRPSVAGGLQPRCLYEEAYETVLEKAGGYYHEKWPRSPPRYTSRLSLGIRALDFLPSQGRSSIVKDAAKAVERAAHTSAVGYLSGDRTPRWKRTPSALVCTKYSDICLFVTGDSQPRHLYEGAHDTVLEKAEGYGHEKSP